MPSLRLTVTAIKDLPIPADGKRIWYHDTETRYLAVRVSSSGKKTYYHYRNVKRVPQQTRLGEYPDFKLDAARREVDRLNGAIADGASPTAERAAAKAELTFDQLLSWYETNHGSRKKSGHRDRRYVELYFPELLPQKISAITRTQIRQLHARCGALPPTRGEKETRTYSSNRALAVVHAVFARACDDEIFEGRNPADAVKLHPETSRERKILPGEVAAFFRAVDAASEDIRDYVLLSLLTAARRSNVLAMAWGEIDFKRAEWRIPVTKNGSAQIIPLEAQEIAILKARKEKAKQLALDEGKKEDPWVFPGKGSEGHRTKPEKGWQAILTESGLKDLHLHDLRRTMGSWMTNSGARLEVIGKALGHKSQAATLVYARLDLDPIREAKRAAMGAMHGTP